MIEYEPKKEQEKVGNQLWRKEWKRKILSNLHELIKNIFSKKKKERMWINFDR